ncbi:MAG: hypothetical protein ACK5V3_12250, partial [Bdellovibrionales bacterium]
CEELDKYLSQLWQASEIDNFDKKLQVISKVDNFQSTDFIFQKKSPLSCYLVKDFSALQGHLEKAKPNAGDIELIAKAWLDQKKYITNCFSQDEKADQQNFLLQIDLNIQNLDWNRVGFDFWNTTKILTSWAWRKTSSLKQVSQTFHHLFKSTVLEESMMLIPNGCRSLTPPSCSEETLSENSIRELAKMESGNLEHFSRIPLGPEKKLVQASPPQVNSDILDFGKFENLSSWTSHFRKNLISARGLSKNRIQNGLQLMERISQNISLESLNERLLRLIELAQMNNSQAKKVLHTTCQELRLAFDSRFNFHSQDIETAFKSPVLEKINQKTDRSIKSIYSYAQQAGNLVLSHCDQASDKRLTEVDSEILKKTDYRPWAQHILFEGQPVEPMQEEERKPFDKSQMSLLWNPSVSHIEDNTLCYDQVDCLRSLVESAVEIRAAVQYASAFLKNTGEVLSSSMINPYSELMACQIYDPWIMSRRSIQNLVKDTINTVLFGWNYFPVYLDFTKGIPKVTSLEKIVEEGTLKFAPKFQNPQMQSQLLLDFGPLVGVPCSLAISNGPGAAAQMSQLPYYLTGVTVNYCDSKGQLDNKAENASTVRSEPQQNSNKCMGCTIGLVSAESVISFYNSKAVAPIKFSVQVFKTISNFLSARKDTVNIPARAQVNPEYAARVFQQYSTIPDQCVDQVSRGLACFQNLCAAQSAHEFERRTGLKVKNSTIVPRNGEFSHENSIENYAYIESDLCDGEIRFSVNCMGPENVNFDFRNLMSFEKNCQSKISQLKQELNL